MLVPAVGLAGVQGPKGLLVLVQGTVAHGCEVVPTEVPIQMGNKSPQSRLSVRHLESSDCG